MKLSGFQLNHAPSIQTRQAEATETEFLRQPSRVQRALRIYRVVRHGGARPLEAGRSRPHAGNGRGQREPFNPAIVLNVDK